MKCQDIQDLILSDYIDGEIDEEREKMLFLHLEECEHCRAFLKDAQILKNLKALKSIKPSQDVEGKIFERIEGKKRPKAFGKYNFRKIVAVGLSVAVVTAVAVISSKYLKNGGVNVSRTTESLLEEPVETYYLLQNGEDLIYSTMYMEVY